MNIRKWFKDSSVTKTTLTNTNVCGDDSGANEMVGLENLSNETQVHSVDRAAGVIMNGPTTSDDVIAVAVAVTGPKLQAIDDLGNEGPKMFMKCRVINQIGFGVVLGWTCNDIRYVDCSCYLRKPLDGTVLCM